MKKIILLFLLFCSKSYSQGFATYTSIINSEVFSVDDKIAHIDLLLNKELKKDTLENYFKTIDIYTTWLYRRERMDKDISVLLSSIKNTPTQDKRSLEKRWYKLAIIYRAAGKYRESIPFYEKVIQSNTVEHYYFLALRYISDAYYELGDYELSRKYYDFSEQEALSRKNYRELIINLSSINNYLIISLI